MLKENKCNCRISLWSPFLSVKLLKHLVNLDCILFGQSFRSLLIRPKIKHENSGRFILFSVESSWFHIWSDHVFIPAFSLASTPNRYCYHTRSAGVLITFNMVQPSTFGHLFASFFFFCPFLYPSIWYCVGTVYTSPVLHVPVQQADETKFYLYNNAKLISHRLFFLWIF